MRWTALLILLLSLSAGPLPASSQAPETTELRDQRYCEVLLGSGGLIVPSRLEVYNTIGLNTCPANLWSRMTVASVKKETGAKFVKLNGPRHWVIDNFVNSQLQNTQVRNFGGIAMREAGVLEVSLSMLSGKPYRVHTVHRKTIVRFGAGKPVYQLIDPDGSVYFMQSYSDEGTPQSLDSLPQLAHKLHLPKGWAYRSVILKQDFLLKADNDTAEVVQDNLLNTYQKSTAHAGDDF